MKIKCRRLSFGPEPKSQEPHSRMLKDSGSWRFLDLKSFAKMMIAQKGHYISLRKSQGRLFESF